MRKLLLFAKVWFREAGGSYSKPYIEFIKYKSLESTRTPHATRQQQHATQQHGPSRVESTPRRYRRLYRPMQLLLYKVTRERLFAHTRHTTPRRQNNVYCTYSCGQGRAPTVPHGAAQSTLHALNVPHPNGRSALPTAMTQGIWMRARMMMNTTLTVHVI